MDYSTDTTEGRVQRKCSFPGTHVGHNWADVNRSGVTELCVCPGTKGWPPEMEHKGADAGFKTGWGR